MGDAYLALAQDQVKGIMAHLKKQMPKDLDEAKEMALKMYNSVVELLKKQMPKDLDEAKEMALKMYNSVVELIHARSPSARKISNSFFFHQKKKYSEDLKIEREKQKMAKKNGITKKKNP